MIRLPRHGPITSSREVRIQHEVPLPGGSLSVPRGRRWPGYATIILLIGLVGGLAMGSIAGARRSNGVTKPTRLIIVGTATMPSIGTQSPHLEMGTGQPLQEPGWQDLHAFALGDGDLLGLDEVSGHGRLRRHVMTMF